MKKYLNFNSICSFIFGIITICISVFAIKQIYSEEKMTLILWIFLIGLIIFGILLIIYSYKEGNKERYKNIRLTKEEKEKRK